MRGYGHAKKKKQKPSKYSSGWLNKASLLGKGSLKGSYCDSNGDGVPDFLIKNYRNPAVNKQTLCNYSDFQKLGLLDPVLGKSSGGTCEWSANSIDGLYCPDMEFGGFLNATFYHNGKAPPYDLADHDLTTTFRSAVYDFIEFDEWYHVAFTRNGYEGAMYINGDLIAVSTIMKNNALVGASDTIFIGATANSNMVNDHVLNGRIDQPSVWDRTLSQNDIAELYNSGEGQAYDDWSEDLKIDSEYAIEINEDLGNSLTPEKAQSINKASNLSVVSLYQHSDSDPFTVNSGKVSNYSFTPFYDDALMPANLPYSGPYDDQLDRENSLRRSMSIPRGLPSSFDRSWSLAAWVSPHGHGLSGGSDQFKSWASKTQPYQGQDYYKAYGTVFSEYYFYENWDFYPNGRRKSPDANFSITLSGLHL